MTDPGYNFDFSGDAAPIATRAVENVAPDALRQLFERLDAANRSWSDPTHGPRGATLASLMAVATFLHANAANAGGTFSRPLDLLFMELRAARAADPPNILPSWDSRQTSERNRRKLVNYLKAAGVYTADRLHEGGVKLPAACAEVAAVLLAHGFPVTERQRQDGKLAEYIERCRARYPDAKDEAAKFFQSFRALPPIAPTHFDPRTQTSVATSEAELLQWLGRELVHGSYER
jgi:hypothetical protein